MKRAFPILTSVLLALVLALAPLGAGGRVAAQAPSSAPAPSEWASVAIVKVKPEMITEYADLQKNEFIPALKKGGIKERAVWQPAFFGPAYEYHIITPIDGLARYDSPGPFAALGEDGARALGAKYRRLVESSTTYLMRYRADLSSPPQMTGPPKLAIVTFISTASGRGTDFANVIKSDVSPAVRKAQTGYLVFQTMLGGDINGFVTVAPVESFATLTLPTPIVKAMGQDAYDRLTAKTAGLVTGLERHVMQFNPDLSFRPATSP
jgi:hypothetical protein